MGVARRKEKELRAEIAKKEDEIQAMNKNKKDWPSVVKKLEDALKVMEADYEKKLEDKEDCVNQIIAEMTVVTQKIDDQKEKYEKEYNELQRSTTWQMYTT